MFDKEIDFLLDRIYDDNRHQHSYKLQHGHDILKIFDVLSNFPFTTSETKSDY